MRRERRPAANGLAGAGDDTVDTVDASTGAAATTGVYYLFGGVGRDTITGGGAYCVISVQGSDCTMTGSAASDATNIFYDGHGGSNTVYGGLSGVNYFYLTGGADVLYGGDSGDFYNITGNGGDTVHGGNGDDIIHDATGGNRIYLGNGADTVWAIGANNDIIVGGSGDDTFFVGATDFFTMFRSPEAAAVRSSTPQPAKASIISPPAPAIRMSWLAEALATISTGTIALGS